MSLFVVEIVENTLNCLENIFFKIIIRDVYCCCRRGVGL
jgi:hypothetical protein